MDGRVLFTLMILPFILLLNFYWLLHIQSDGTTYILSGLDNICTVLKRERDGPYAVLRQHITTRYSSTYKDYTLNNCEQEVQNTKGSSWQLLYRPIVGDHIHIGIKIVLNNKEITLHDRNITEKIPYENKSETCPAPGHIAYTKTWLHNGIHTHCDGMVHVHPFSAFLKKEGRDARLSEWFQSTGIEDYNHHIGRGYKYNNGYHNLQMHYYEHVEDDIPALATSDHLVINNLWLHQHHAFIVIFDETSDVPTITEADRNRVNSYSVYPSSYPYK